MRYGFWIDDSANEVTYFMNNNWNILDLSNRMKWKSFNFEINQIIFSKVELQIYEHKNETISKFQNKPIRIGLGRKCYPIAPNGKEKQNEIHQMSSEAVIEV